MNIKTNPNDPINMATTDSGHMGAYPGLTIRQHFASLAMQGMCASEHATLSSPETVAKWSVKVADALIEELNK